jgi:hypothetical protein
MRNYIFTLFALTFCPVSTIQELYPFIHYPKLKEVSGIIYLDSSNFLGAGG